MANANKTERLNRLWAKVLIDACVQRGVDHFFVAPGSRCTPLTIALSETRRVHIVQHFDERGLGFAAVGFGRSAGFSPVDPGKTYQHHILSNQIAALRSAGSNEVI